MKNIDYTGKCGTCVHFERDGERRAGWCHKDAYDESVAHDPKHPYRERSMSCSCRYYSDTRPTNADRIRAMSDEELKEVVVPPDEWCTMFHCGQFDDNCFDCTLAWLQQPVEED